MSISARILIQKSMFCCKAIAFKKIMLLCILLRCIAQPDFFCKTKYPNKDQKVESNMKTMSIILSYVI